ncbi:MAG: MFS transporter [Trueperaceae bacterium]|nr:MAG: MFS transporter [Trueperaceae bacterium]
MLFASFAAGYFLSYFLRSANAVIAPVLQAELALGPADLGFMTGTFFAAYAASQLPVGLALDRLGPRLVAGGLMALGALGCVVFAVATDLATLTLGRVLLGVGLGSVLLAGLKAFSLWWPPQRFATVSGVFFATGSLGALAAATPLALLETAVGWRSAFWLFALVVLAVTLLVFTATPRGGGRPAGAVPRETPEAGLGTDLARLMLFGACFTGPILAFQTLWAGPMLFDVFGYDAVRTGNLLLLLSLGVTLGYASSGALADRFGLARVSIAALGAFALAQAALALLHEPSLPWLLPLFGFAGGHCILALPNARRRMGTARSGRATGTVNAASIAGAFALQWAVGALVATLSEPAAGYRAALFATSGLSLLALLAYLPLARRIGA